jgi:hypothetical protein
MKVLPWLAATLVFAAFFAIYSYHLGVAPAFMHDDYEYTYPSFTLAEHGSFGSPLLGTGLNIGNRTYNLTIYYYATVHALLIRLFGDTVEAIPLANTFHFALLAAGGVGFLLRRRAVLGVFVFLCGLVEDRRLIESARHGRPEVTAGFCLTMAAVALWIWLGEGNRHRVVLFGMSAALTAGALSHTSVLLFAAALVLVFSVPLARTLRRGDLLALALPFAVIPLLYGYFLLTDEPGNLAGQLAIAQTNVSFGRILFLPFQGNWRALLDAVGEFSSAQGWGPGLAATAVVGLLAAALLRGRAANGAGFFGAVFLLCLSVHFLWLKLFVSSYRALYVPILYLALALLAEALMASLHPLLANRWRLAIGAIAITLLACVGVNAAVQFHERVHALPSPYARLRGALMYALLGSGARPGDRVFVPSPFGFHLRKDFDVIAHPAPRFFEGRWSPEFRQGVRAVFGEEALSRVEPRDLCWAMGLAFARPQWVVSWNGEYSTMLPYRDFLRRFPRIPGIALTEGLRAPLPWPYGGVVRVYHLSLARPILALDRTVDTTLVACP